MYNKTNFIYKFLSLFIIFIILKYGKAPQKGADLSYVFFKEFF